MVRMAMVKLNDETRNALRRYKAQDGQTYDEAINELLTEVGWQDD